MANINGQQVKENRIDVLDKGYVRLEAITGSDLSTVNSAKVSYDKKATEFTEREKRLIKFLATHGHTSPFRHAFVTFEVFAPLMIARQWYKYQIGSAHEEIAPANDPFFAWNESSRRYITEEPEFYLPAPNEWRKAPENSKQGSGDAINSELGMRLTETMLEHQLQGLVLYEELMELGVCAEQARLALPAYGLYVRWYWSASIQGVAHMLNQRLAHDSQKEFQQYARAVYDIMIEHFPVSIDELVKLAEEQTK
ncbi:FAD-dependent thymidylate synthase [Bacillus sporothermodurans]|uniref:FAD-dependent thymidylate synthase n=1 Tax=Heyndrickxia sporothermodurans TaxID=46224 RepID=UPI00192BCD0D|nr:FAD-dependent thymidylate synthase [Heyndrickxia sporothermodurans]MBL5776962.1 FAD-dependent thymidylate synthase [Heyndrickxia sporothermodurans]MBL5798489.1 FAD-dependent thymidylate synthase [Heyndrickxia sporothermodurans]MBL5809406.1 FAD-dependent thymidylate synthase [Heyndrickxia sporothermodurans]MBL5813041.1 FAD-dependent thymidylate synthase [Heyndrickxia sporothermodurans]MBL5816465.1 FAD-dependent thymidylate synthase [Heyndrickxia sporothermodurans]